MKKIFLFLMYLAVFNIAGTAQATPMVYVFEGIGGVVVDDAGAAAAAGLSDGSHVTYKIIFDFDVDGYFRCRDDTIEYFPDDSHSDHFYVDYFSGDAMQPVNGGYYNDPTDVLEWNCGFTNNPTVGSGLVVGSSNSKLSFDYAGSPPLPWEVGSGWFFKDLAYDDFGAVSVFCGRLEITGIALVSEPGTLLLLGFGLLGLVSFRKKGVWS